MRVLAIDFGTSNTVAMLRTPDGRMRPLLFDGAPLLPSAVYLESDGRALVGRDAMHSARLDPGRFEPNPKRRVDDGQVLLGGVEVAVPRLFGYVLGDVFAEARRQLAGPPDEVRLTHPARWGDRRRSLLVEGARLAGLGTPRLIPEPVAAASYFTAVLGSAVPVGRSLGIYDLGGGTFDATVVRRTPTGFDVLAEEGLPDIGGLDFDQAIVEQLGRVYGEMPPWARLVNPVDSSDRRNRRMLYDDVCAAKERLSRTSNADINLPTLEVDAHLTRDELEGLIRGYLGSTVACLHRTIENARLRPADLVAVFLVGGSSRIPMAARLIHAELGMPPTTLDQPETVVAEGALCIGAAVQPGGVSGVPRTMPPPARPAPAAPVSGQPVGRPVSGQPVSGQPISGQPVAPGRPVSGPGRPVSGQPVGPAMAARAPVQPPRQGQPTAAPARQQQPAVQRPPVRQVAGPQSGPAVPPPAGKPPTAQPVAQPVSQPVSQVPPPAARPVTPPGARPVPPRSQPVSPPMAQPMSQPRPGYPQQQRERRWYTEPVAIATVIVLILVVIAFLILLNQAGS
jgi:molecular chaperone DnaK